MITASILLIMVLWCFFSIDPLRNLKQTAIENCTNEDHSSLSLCSQLSPVHICNHFFSHPSSIKFEVCFSRIEFPFDVNNNREANSCDDLFVFHLNYFFRLSMLIFCFRRTDGNERRSSARPIGLIESTRNVSLSLPLSQFNQKSLRFIWIAIVLDDWVSFDLLWLIAFQVKSIPSHISDSFPIQLDEKEGKAEGK